MTQKDNQSLRLGIVVALGSEARSLGLRARHCNDVQMLPGHGVVCVSGIGRARASATARRLLSDGAQALISWGTAVSLDPELQPGQLLLPRQVLHPETGPMAVSAGWQDELRRRFAGRFAVCDEPMATTDLMLLSPADKRRLGSQTGAASADMESAELALVARQAQIPFVIVRSVADSVDTPVPDWTGDAIGEDGELRLATVLPEIVMNPGDWTAMIRLARDFNKALGTLRRIAGDRPCETLSPGKAAREPAPHD